MNASSPSTPVLADRPPALVGQTGVVVSRVRGGEAPGEVRLVLRGLPSVVLAYADRPLPVGAHVLVVLDRGSRRVDVCAWSAPIARSL
ncbi:MAG: hypothetical protein JWN17_2355 [Frankiales bacterium]|nr:hypothetical protein [Frankiales bacterium]